MEPKIKSLKCVKCGKEYNPDKNTLGCKEDNGYFGYLEVQYDYEKITEFPLENEKGMARYMPLLPIINISHSLNENKTPLFELKRFGKRFSSTIWVKDETKSITGCFKDRESFVLVNKAIEFGHSSLIIVSSGNAALSLSAYATPAGIKCTCFVPTNTLKEKKELIEFFGGSTSTLGENYEDCYHKVVELDCTGWNCSSGLNPYAAEGDKTIAFEIFEELGVPDKIIVPCGNGTNLAGIYKGFKELKILGKTGKIPQMIGVQIKGQAPIAEAIKQGKLKCTITNLKKSIAESIVAMESYSSPKAVMAIKESGGIVVEVDDNEVSEALKELINEESFLIEPSSASVFAALKKIPDKGENIVCVATGTGLKMLEEIYKMLRE